MKIMIAGGGTGGHLFAGIAIAQEFLKRRSENKIVFIGSKEGIESRVLANFEFGLKTVNVKGFKGKGVFEKIISVFSVPVALMQAAYHLKRFDADIVVGVGGYISFPAVVAGFAMRVPTVIHEQNSMPGLSNRMLGRFSKKIFVSYEESRKFFQKGKTVFSGMPVRDPIQKEAARKKDERFCVFILGGSQGAREINRAVAEALPYLSPMREKMRFIHQTGKTDFDLLKKNYNKFGFSARVYPFIEDIFGSYKEADLVISRAGAATLAELALYAKAAIIIPYPFAAGNHQKKNALAFVDRGAALMMLSQDLNGKSLSSEIMRLEKDRRILQQMENQARILARPKAAATIVDECCRLVSRN